MSLLGLMLAAAGCNKAPVPETGSQPVPGSADRYAMEGPVPDGNWRAHLLSWCDTEGQAPAPVESYLGLCSEYFRDGSGSDGMLELEIALEEGLRHPLILMTLGQLYLMAGQGEPALLPGEGPAGDVGDWDRNKARLLGRAEKLLREAGQSRQDDAAVDYLLADVVRARGEFDFAADLVASAHPKCTGGRSFRILQLYQQLNRYPARHLGGPGPVYPQSALEARLTGDVTLDLLLDPGGQVRSVVPVSSPGAALTEAASRSLREGEFEAARLGKYPVWAWLRVTTAFNLSD